mmetsp:Transcript_50255/g.129370  ORF Transcript_50255/g.129370 Transcript_50255/m.129370 type:complete len:470 (-) Transcript_50255:258-1667(-)
MEKYNIVKRIGRGANGSAYYAEGKADGKKYVIKQIPIDLPEEREEAMQEVHHMKELTHPNIVEYHEFFIDDEDLCIVMAYCEGGDLYSVIQEKMKSKDLFKEEEILNWFVQLALALQYMHSKRMLHRDLKSQNIFLTKNRKVIKLGDFGIARKLQETLEMAQTCVGTPFYMSPELCQNRPYSYKSDVWALGCVLYELATLKHAFDAKNLSQLVLKIVRGTYPPIPSRYSSDLSDLIKAMLEQEPDDRPSVSEILNMPFLKRRAAALHQERGAAKYATPRGKQAGKGAQIFDELEQQEEELRKEIDVYSEEAKRLQEEIAQLDLKKAELAKKGQSGSDSDSDEEYEDDFEEYEDEEDGVQDMLSAYLRDEQEEGKSASAEEPIVAPAIENVTSINERRVGGLRTLAEEKMGKEKFLSLYSYLLDHRIDDGGGGVTYDKDNDEMMLDLETLVGEENIDYVALVEQVLLSEL